MDNSERLEFLKQKPNYACRFHPYDGWHVVGCSHKEWTKEELQGALDSARRSLELHNELSRRDLLHEFKHCYNCLKPLIPYLESSNSTAKIENHSWYCPCSPNKIISIG